jgi:class 3 adenylate cyclase/tetratricopeptide (TPR) repeat protein
VPEAQGIGGETAFERRIVSVLFADLVGFTALSERLDPEDVATIQDAYFATVRETVARHGGVLEKFIGDAAMAVFGVPKARDDDAERAIRAGLALVGAVELLGARLGLAADEAGLRLRVGVNSGEVVSAETGPDAGRVTGDTVNLAARFQTAADAGSVLVGELTQLSAADAVEFEAIGAMELKGKAGPVPAWRVTGLRPERSREEALGALRAPLLGRAEELEHLDAALADVVERHSARIELIVAPPGVGKSRVLTEFATQAEAAGAHILLARVRADQLGPIEPIEQLLRAAVAGAGVSTADRSTAVDGLGRALAATAMPPSRVEIVTEEVVAALWPTTDTRTTGSGPRAEERDARLGAWLEALDALNGGAVSTWLIEDVHWAGGDLRAFLDLAARWPSQSGRLMVATARPSVLEQAWPAARVLELPSLPTVESSQLVTALIGDVLPAELVADVADRSDGNPLFIEELLRSWISSGVLVSSGDGWALAIPPEQVPVPATVQAIYAAQLDDLPTAARLLARRASVAGRRFRTAALGPLEVPEPAEGLAQLRRRAFLRGPEADEAGDEVYVYRHALLRDAGYASLSRAERVRLHLTLADWLEQVAGADASRVAEPIASHCESALGALPMVGAADGVREDVTARCLLWLERAADAALAVSAHEAAIGLLGRAMALVDPGSPEAARLQLRRARLLAATADMDLAIAEMEEALQVARDTLRAEAVDGDAERLGPARAAYGEVVLALGDAMIEQARFPQAHELTTVALEELTPPEDVLAGRLMALHAWANVAWGKQEGVLAEAARALEVVRGTDPMIEIEVRERVVQIRSETTGVVAEDWGSLAELARQHRQWAVAITAMTMHTRYAEADLGPRAALAQYQDALDLALTHGLSEKAVWARYNYAAQLARLGDWDDAMATGMDGIEAGERYAYIRVVFRIWMALAVILAARGEPEPMARFAAWFEANRAAFPDPPSAFAQVLGVAINGRLRSLGLTSLFDWETTPEVVASVLYDQADWFDAVEAVIWEWIRNGDLPTASEAHRAVEAQAKHQSEAEPKEPIGTLLHASLSLMAAWLARAQGETDSASTHAREALAWARTAEAPWWVARAIRAIPEGMATVDEQSEADAIELWLKVADGATAPPL